jgi:putative transposase
MQLIAARTGQKYNRREGRKGAHREDRYHATALDTEDYLPRCMFDIDLNTARAAVVSHPAQWSACGYREIQVPSVRRMNRRPKASWRCLGSATQTHQMPRRFSKLALSTELRHLTVLSLRGA